MTVLLGGRVAEYALGHPRAEALVPGGLAQELDDLAQLVLGVVDAGDVVPAHRDLGLGLICWGLVLGMTFSARQKKTSSIVMKIIVKT